MSNATSSSVLLEVLSERHRQDEKWGEQDHDDGKWLLILNKKLGEACQASLDTDGMSDGDQAALLRNELVQVAAVAVAWIEAIDQRSLA